MSVSSVQNNMPPRDASKRDGNMQTSRGKLLFVVTEDWYFVSHRLSLAQAAQAAGYQVAVVTRISRCRAEIENAGLRLIPLRHLSRVSRNPWTELRAIAELIGIYRRERPDVVHHVALKPVVYGSIAARIAPSAVVNALGGLGFVFSSTSRKARLLRPLIRLMLRWTLNGKRSALILQNPEDCAQLSADGIVPSRRIRLIRGAGVDSERFVPQPEPTENCLVVLASRMLWDKGVKDFVHVAHRLREAGLKARFALVGDSDPGNPAAVPVAQLEEWHRAGTVEWWGRRGDMPAIFAQASIVCLPSTYGEGVPKVLIEAAASGRPIVAYDVPGCREIVHNEKNGILVPPRDVDRLVEAVRMLLDDAPKRRAMGDAGRQLVMQHFRVETVIEQTLGVYRELRGEGA